MSKSVKILSSFILGMIISMFFISNSLAQSGDKISVVLFHTGWNIQCRKALSYTKNVVKTYDDKVEFIKLNVDDPKTPSKARELNLPVPNKAPYIYVLDKKNNVLLKMPYSDENASELKTKLDEVILPKL
ncbi:MAG: thioredoxin family protein [Candidatus Gastranaerophilales bacterium]|nr:thioredoxin family protein [Candidatus Gastranaerophilales bacterium]